MTDEDRPRGAILQRDKRTWAIVPRTPVGLVTPETLETIARVAREHDVPLLKITSGQRLAMLGLERDEVDEVWRKLGMDVGPAGELCVHYVQACPGTDWCKLGKRDSLALGRRLEAALVGREMPAKVKLGVSGCAICCAESRVRDIGLFAKKAGWTVVFGGSAGAKPRVADVVVEAVDEERAFAVALALLDDYVAHAKRKERTARYVRRVGIEAIRERVLAAVTTATGADGA